MVYAPDKLQSVLGAIPLSEVETLEPDIRVDVSQDTPWTKEARQQTLDNLLEKQQITFDEYVHLLPDNSIVPKNELLKALAQRQIQQQEMAAQQQEMAQQPQEPPEQSAISQ